MARAPERRGDALVKRPADREFDDGLAEALPCETIEPFHGSEILREARLLKLGIAAAQVIALEFAVRAHPAGEQASAQRAIAEGGDAVLAAIGQNVGLDPALEQIVGGLQHVQRRNAAELLHMLDRKITHADGATLSLLEQRLYLLRG